MKDKYKTWIEISKSNLESNLTGIKKSVSHKVKILAIVKANAYGHGLVEVSKTLENKVDFFGVDNIDEAMVIRNMGIKTPILVLGFVPNDRLMQAASNDISIALYNLEFFDFIKSKNFSSRLKIHLKIETGMNRQGVKKENLNLILDNLAKFSGNVSLEGIYSHFSDPGDTDFTKFQFAAFQKVLEIVKNNGFKDYIKHISASAGILNDKKYQLDMVRAGISLYGYLPYTRQNKGPEDLKFKPVLCWKSIIAQIKWLERGEFVGYGRTWKAKNKTKIAVIPVGYYDGFDRRFSNNGKVLINGQFANIIGRIAMNMFMVNITNIKNLNIEDEVIIIGNADELAKQIGTINHEILSRLNPLIPKIIVG